MQSPLTQLKQMTLPDAKKYFQNKLKQPISKLLFNGNDQPESDEKVAESSASSSSDPKVKRSTLAKSFKERKEEVRYFIQEQLNLQKHLKTIVDQDLNQQDDLLRSRLMQRGTSRTLSRSQAKIETDPPQRMVGSSVQPKSTFSQPFEETLEKKVDTSLEIKKFDEKPPNFVDDNDDNNSDDDENEGSEETEEVLEDLFEKQMIQLNLDRDEKIERIVRSFNIRINNLRQQFQNYEEDDHILKMMEELEKQKWKEIKTTEQTFQDMMTARRDFMKRYN